MAADLECGEDMDTEDEVSDHHGANHAPGAGVLPDHAGDVEVAADAGVAADDDAAGVARPIWHPEGAALPTNASRFRGKAVFLTYAGLEVGELSHYMLETAMIKWEAARGAEVTEFVIGVEKHPEPTHAGKPEHVHMAYYTTKQYDMKTTALVSNGVTLDTMIMQGRDNRALKPYAMTIKPTAGDRTRVFQYVMKDMNVRTRLCGKLLLPGEDNKGDWGEAIKNCRSEKEAWDILAEHYPREYFARGTFIGPMLAKYFGKDFEQRKYMLNQFNTAPLKLNPDVEGGSACWVLYGKSGTGKSAYACAHDANTIVINRLEQLKVAPPSTKVIVFNDCDFSNLTKAEHYIALLDADVAQAIPCRYGDATIEAGVARIFTTNSTMKDGDSIFPKFPNKEHNHAIKRRYKKMKIKKKLFD